MSFLNFKDHIEDGDTIIAFMGYNKMQPISISKHGVLQTKYGAFPHSDLIGKPFGTKIYSKNKKGWMYVLYPTPELWTTTLPHRTQILYTTDISMALLQLDLKPGSIVVEAGTGSGSMSHAIMRTIAPSGHLHTFEFHDQRAEMARKEFSKHGLAGLVTVEHKDVIKDGFGLKDVADAVFLDLPSPWDAIETSKDALKVCGGHLCSFSPCIEQVQRTCEELQKKGFKDIRTMECLLRTYSVKTISIQEPNFGNDEGKEDVDDEKGRSCRKRTRDDDDDDDDDDDEDEEEDKEEDSEVSLESNTVTRTRVVTHQKLDKVMDVVTARPSKQIPGHTGYLTFATLYP